MKSLKGSLICTFASLVIFVLTPSFVSASPFQGFTPTYNLLEFNIAFVLGLSLPILIIIALLNPVLKISWRYPALLTIALLAQFYSLTYVEKWQVSILLISSSAFILFSSLWLIEQRKTCSYQGVFQKAAFALFTIFVVSVASLREVDVYLLSLGFALLMAAASLFIQFQSDNKQNFRVVLVWAAIVAYAGATYSWLNVQLEAAWFIALAVLSYLMVIVNGCWELVENIREKFDQIKLAMTSEVTIKEPVKVDLDPITNLPSYQQSLFRLKKTLQVNPSDEIIAIVFKPLNFEQVNKVLGHQNSDILLLQLAYSLQQSLVENKLLLNFGDDNQSLKISRLQGLDFLVAFNASHSSHPTKILIEDLCQQLSASVPKAMSFKSFTLKFELVFGTANSKQSSHNAEQLIAQASDALLEAQQRNQSLSYFDQQSKVYTERQLAMMEKLRQDVNAENINWLAQPQISLTSREIMGFELIVDWQANNGKRLSNDEFQRIAEFSGEIYQLTRQMISQAFSLLAMMHEHGIKKNVAINLSSKDLLELELADYIESQSNAYNVEMDFLTIELNEHVLLNSAFRARMMIDQLKALGVRVAIDDFSGSYEALRYLRRTSVHQVKVECSELNLEDKGHSEKTIVNALINLIRKMKIPLIATGVNNRNIEKQYLLMGGEIAQGHLIENGVSVTEVKNWLNKWQASLKLG